MRHTVFGLLIAAAMVVQPVAPGQPEQDGPRFGSSAWTQPYPHRSKLQRGGAEHRGQMCHFRRSRNRDLQGHGAPMGERELYQPD